MFTSYNFNTEEKEVMGKLLIRKWFSFFLVLMLAFSVGILAGCEGDDGAQGPQGVQGEKGDKGDKGDQGDPGPGTETEESCNVCHGDGASHEFAAMHPADMDEFLHTEVYSAAFAPDTDQIQVCFMVLDADDELVAVDLSSSRFYLSSIIPAGTETDWGTWDTDYLERWAYERIGNASYPEGVLVENEPGDFCYTFATGFNPDAISELDDVNITVGEMAPDITYGVPGHVPSIPSDVQRVIIRISGQDVGVAPNVVSYANAIVIQDFQLDSDGTWNLLDPQRVLAPISGCKQCHSDKMQGAAHGGSYLDTRGCAMCHTPLGLAYGDEMQEDGAWATNLFHKIHAAIPMPAFENRIGGRGYGAVTYPWVPNEDYVEYGGIQDCMKCHNGSDNMTDAWRSNPTAEACGSCHIGVNFETGEGHGPGDIGGSQPTNQFCAGCHPAQGAGGIGGSVTAKHAIDSSHNYTSSISMTADADNDGIYEVGDTPLVTVTIDGAECNYDAEKDDNVCTNARLYVYGPRTKPVPVLTTMSTTDPAFISMTTDPDDPNYDPHATPQQSHEMYVDTDDVQVMTDADGFKYQLLGITEDLAPGTYMAMAYITHPTSSGWYRGSTGIDGWTLMNFQVGTATPQPKVAGDGCMSCHLQENWGGLFHRSYFGTDGCIGCHDQSGNHADPLANRVHAIHSASMSGDLLGYDWEHVTYPQDIENCETCHNSGNDSYITEPTGWWGTACLGCHADTDGLIDHTIQMGSDYSHWLE